MQLRVKGHAANTAPSFASGSASRMVAENLTSGNVGTPLTATDPDSGDVSAYSVAATGTTSAEMSHLADFNRDFSLNAASGQISVKAAAMIDYETRTSYVVTYEVTDNKNAAGAADTAIDDTLTLTVNVTDVTETPPTTNTAPSFASGSASRSVAENLTSGNVGTPVTATDPDSGDVLAYSVSATGATSAEMSHLADFNRDFSLSASGQISVRAAAMIDYEARTSYVVTYRVSDNKNAAGAADTAIDDTLTLTVNVTDVTETMNTAPSFASGSTSRMVAENLTSGNVGTPVAATDPDSGDVLAYSVAAASVTDAALHLADFERDFSLSASGQIRVRAGALIDHEARDTYVVTYRVSDNKNATGAADPSVDATLVLTVGVTDVNEAGVVVVSGGLRPGVSLSAVLSDPDGAVSVVWQWARGDAAAGPFVDVAGETGALFVLSSADEGKFVRATATYSDVAHSVSGQTASGGGGAGDRGGGGGAERAACGERGERIGGGDGVVDGVAPATAGGCWVMSIARRRARWSIRVLRGWTRAACWRLWSAVWTPARFRGSCTRLRCGPAIRPATATR